MKLIFLDIDGVLNCKYTLDRISDNSSIIGVEDKKLDLLKNIVDSCNDECRIILTSSWKIDWYKDNKNSQGIGANYLDRKFKEHGLSIYDKTKDMSWNRGKGIRDYIRDSKEDIRQFLVLDDSIFRDYGKEKIIEHLVLTDIIHGLDEYHTTRAIEILNKK